MLTYQPRLLYGCDVCNQGTLIADILYLRSASQIKDGVNVMKHMCRDTAGTKRDHSGNPGCDVWHADLAGDSCNVAGSVPTYSLGRLLLAALLHLGRCHSVSRTR